MFPQLHRSFHHRLTLRGCDATTLYVVDAWRLGWALVTPRPGTAGCCLSEILPTRERKGIKRFRCRQLFCCLTCNSRHHPSEFNTTSLGLDPRSDLSSSIAKHPYANPQTKLSSTSAQHQETMPHALPVTPPPSPQHLPHSQCARDPSFFSLDCTHTTNPAVPPMTIPRAPRWERLPTPELEEPLEGMFPSMTRGRGC